MKASIILVFIALIFSDSCSPKELSESGEINYSLTHAFRLVVEDHSLRTWSLQTKIIEEEEAVDFYLLSWED